MKKSISTIPGYKIYEYLLVLNPHEALRNRIIQVKMQFQETYQSDAAVYTKPHIPIVRFMQYQLMEERLVNRLKTIAMGFPPTKIELKDFASLPAHTIYINISSKIPVQSLLKKIRSEAGQLMKLNKEHQPYFIMEPQITIARRLQPWQYEKAWLEYSHKHFSGRFIADAMLLLRRPMGEMKYEIAQRFEFQNLPVTTTQGMLFAAVSEWST
jgi:2'-5' RNA ligase